MDTHATITGNLTRDPEIRFTPAGTPVASFGVAASRRWKDRNDEWQEETSFFDVTCWKDLAQNVSDSLSKGDRVIVTGRLEQQSWEKDGDKRSKIVLIADEVGPSLRWATCEVQKTSRRDAEAAEQVKTAFGASEEPF